MCLFTLLKISSVFGELVIQWKISSTNDGHFEKSLPLVLVGISLFFKNVSLMIPIQYPSNIKMKITIIIIIIIILLVLWIG
jgi:hypothetical protein